LELRRYLPSSPYLLVAVSNWGSKAVSVLAQLAIVPMLTRALGAEQYAVLAVVLSLASWIALADLGLGNTVQNRVSQAIAREGDVGGAVGLVLWSSMIIGTIGIAALLCTASPLADLIFRKFENIDNQLARAALVAGGVFLVFQAIGVLSTKVLYALGRGVLANALTAIASILTIGAVAWAVAAPPSHFLLVGSVVASTAPLGLIGVAAASWLVLSYGCAREGIRLLRGSGVWRQAGGFWIFAILSNAVFGIEYLVMSQTLPAEEITKYNILYRVFWAGMALYIGVLGAAWPVAAQRIAKSDWAGAIALMRNNVAFGFAGVLAMTVAAALGMNWLLSWLVPRSDLQVHLSTVLLFGTYLGCRVWTDSYSVLLLAANDTGVFLRWTPLQAVLGVVAQFTLASVLGIDGIVLGLMLPLIITGVWVLPKRVRSHAAHAAPNV
jgi:O-antigen/teichoic acid export membrane protein